MGKYLGMSAACKRINRFHREGAVEKKREPRDAILVSPSVGRLRSNMDNRAPAPGKEVPVLGLAYDDHRNH